MSALQFSVPEGGDIVVTWPDKISVNSIDLFEECIALQIKSLRRRAIAKQDGELEYESWSALASGQKGGAT